MGIKDLTAQNALCRTSNLLEDGKPLTELIG
jgi:hypothetical protein